MSFARACFLAVLFVLCLSAPAGFAQYGGGVQEPVDGDPCPGMTAEECFWGGASGPGGTINRLPR